MCMNYSKATHFIFSFFIYLFIFWLAVFDLLSKFNLVVIVNRGVQLVDPHLDVDTDNDENQPTIRAIYELCGT